MDISLFDGHTPGPWGHLPAKAGYQAQIVLHPSAENPTGTLLAGVGAGRETPIELINANARLIAAAPDLLAEVIRLRALLAKEAPDAPPA